MSSFALPSERVRAIRDDLIDLPVSYRDDRPCRWCGGDGLDPFLPTRIRQFFTRGPFMVVEVWESFAGSFVERREVPRLLADVSTWNPFNQFLEYATTELTGRTDVVYTPFDLAGRTYHGLRCKRCRGSGRKL